MANSAVTASVSRDIISMSKQNPKQCFGLFSVQLLEAQQKTALYPTWLQMINLIHQMYQLSPFSCEWINVRPSLLLNEGTDEAFFSPLFTKTLALPSCLAPHPPPPPPHPHALHSALIPFKDCYLYPSRQASHSKTVGKPTRSAHKYSGPLLWLCYNFLVRKSKANKCAFSFVAW